MPAFRTGKVVASDASDPSLTRLRVALQTGEVEAVAFPFSTGPVAIGDRVVVNTTGIELGLGTGGEGFVLWNLDGPGQTELGEGHIVKMRYTPWQTEVLAAEAPESEHHELLVAQDGIPGVPVVACGLHSQVGSVAAGIKAAHPSARIGYLMSDGGALPLAWSTSVRLLVSAGLIDATCTYGHAFGGDLEAVNVFSGLVALVHAGRVDTVIAAMGPGVVGTASSLGFTAMEQGQILDAATALGGRSVAALRISFVDERRRHAGISHHTLTALSVAAREPCTIVVPELPEERAVQIEEQLASSALPGKHEIVTADGGDGLRLLADKGIRPSTMGRSLDEAPDLFVAASAAGSYVGTLLRDTLDG